MIVFVAILFCAFIAGVVLLYVKEEKKQALPTGSQRVPGLAGVSVVPLVPVLGAGAHVDVVPRVSVAVA